MLRYVYELPQALPLGSVGGVDRYVRQKGAAYAAGATVAELAMSPQAISSIAANERAAILARCPPGYKPALLVSSLKDILGGQTHRAVDQLGATALTDVFASAYDIDIERAVQGKADALFINAGIVSGSAGQTAYMNYGTSAGEDPGIFWQLQLDAPYGFINMSCAGGLGSTMLSGWANVASVPGVADALFTDVETLRSAA